MTNVKTSNIDCGSGGVGGKFMAVPDVSLSLSICGGGVDGGGGR